jgi:glycosyl-4,4'-diaponeurosporenoate acyltransferase
VLIELSIGATTGWNVIAWAVIQLGLAWVIIRIPAEQFHPASWWARTRDWEQRGDFYERWAGIKAWKDRLPDAGRWFAQGFAKANLQSATPEYLERFIRETWRGEVTHWLALLAVPLFCLWNPWWGVLINAAVALGLNFPCILAQRYNRARLLRLLAAQLRRRSRS